MAVSIKEAAERMGVTQQFLRVGIRQGVFPWGYAVKMSSRYRYHINGGKFNEEYKERNPEGSHVAVNNDDDDGSIDR